VKWVLPLPELPVRRNLRSNFRCLADNGVLLNVGLATDPGPGEFGLFALTVTILKIPFSG
jgi:hypothetical protein